MTMRARNCGLMLAAMECAISASEIPTASHKCNPRRRCGLSVLLASIVMATPLLDRSPFPRNRSQYLTPQVYGLEKLARRLNLLASFQAISFLFLLMADSAIRRGSIPYGSL